MRNPDRTDGRSLRDPRPGERWRRLAQHLVARSAATGGCDDEMLQAAITAILDAERRLGSPPQDFCLMVVPLVIRALRHHRRELIRRRPASAQPLPALQLAIAIAEGELSRHLHRSPTIAEVATYLDMAQHDIVMGLEAGWSAGSRVTVIRQEPV